MSGQMLLHELACLADHFIEESLGLLGVAVSSQHRVGFCCLHAVVGRRLGAPRVAGFLQVLRALSFNVGDAPSDWHRTEVSNPL
jgi:hypothetical protein